MQLVGCAVSRVCSCQGVQLSRWRVGEGVQLSRCAVDMEPPDLARIFIVTGEKPNLFINQFC